MAFHDPINAFESYLEKAGRALISASPQDACLHLTKAIGQFEIVMHNPGNIRAATIAGMQNKLKSLTKLAHAGERIASMWLEAIAPASEMPRSGGVDIYG